MLPRSLLLAAPVLGSSQAQLCDASASPANGILASMPVSVSVPIPVSSGLGSFAAATNTGNVSVSPSISSSTGGLANTQPCNNYVEFCGRKYSNVTVVGCHNSPFVQAGSLAANQDLEVEDQLDDGIRFLQAQMHWPLFGSEPHFCHTSCEILDAGPITDWLRRVTAWVAAHPFDVVTVLLENGNFSTPDRYVPYIEASGLLKYVYTPPKHPMARADWPRLSEMILRGQRVVLFLDYMANETAFPWLLDEFAYVWETPFDPVDASFPCTVQRPPNLAAPEAESRLYLMNHNLNVNITVLGMSVLVPAISLLNTTNNATGNGSLGMAADNCLDAWHRLPPTVLNVDYYDFGGRPGSVFEAAARINNVSYDRPCCGLGRSMAVTLMESMTTQLLVVAMSWAAVAWFV